ncbi:MAG TPA: hypothetical protein VJ579_00935 [Candidatus Paceibacterota bacterium]|nr:hypothetical protein [Candidatus Paceibacterota bacterium]
MSKKYFYLAALLLPLGALAQTSTVDDVLMNFMNLLLALIKLMTPLAMLYFFYQLITFIRASNSGAVTLAKSKDMMIFSGIILFVMVGIWTIVGYVQQSLGTSVTTSDLRQTPAIPTELSE